MSDDPKQPDTQQPAPTPPAPEPQAPEAAPPAPAERTFTQAELDLIVKDRVARERKKHNKPKAQPEPAQDPTHTSEAADIRRELAEQKFEAAALRRGVTDEVMLSTLKHAYLNESPADVSAWLDERKQIFAQAPAPAPTPTETEAAPPAPEPVPDGGAPSPIQDFSGAVDVTRLSRDDVSRLQRSDKFHEVLERYRDSLPGGGNGVFRKRAPKR